MKWKFPNGIFCPLFFRQRIHFKKTILKEWERCYVAFLLPLAILSVEHNIFMRRRRTWSECSVNVCTQLLAAKSQTLTVRSEEEDTKWALSGDAATDSTWKRENWRIMRACVGAYVCACVHAFICIYVRACVRFSACAWVFLHVCTCVRACVPVSYVGWFYPGAVSVESSGQVGASDVVDFEMSVVRRRH